MAGPVRSTDPSSTLASALLLLACLAATVPATAAAPKVGWVRAFGAGELDRVAAVAAGDGGAVSAGQFGGEVTFEAGAEGSRLVSAGHLDVWVARHDAAGDLLWVRGFGGGREDEATGVATAPDGGAWATGFFQGEARFGDERLASTGSTDGFLVRLSPAGEVVSVLGWGREHADAGEAVAVAPDGGVYLAGRFQKGLELGGGELPFAGRTDAFLARLDADGELLWLRGLGGPGREESGGLAVAPDGSVWWTGLFERTAAVVGVDDPVELVSPGGSDLFLLHFTADGELAASRAVVGSGVSRPAGVAVAPDGAPILAAAFQGEVTVPGSTGDEALASGGLYDTLVARWDPHGRLLWARRIGGVGSTTGRGVAALPGGGAVVAGFYAGDIDVDPGEATELLSADITETFVVALDGDGEHAWSATYGGGTGVLQPFAVAATEDGDALFVGGQFNEETRIGPLPLVTPSQADAFLAKLLTP